jgi:tRNA1(Val) A37 N6-methylase TrmN6
MRRHETPAAISTALARYAPRKMRRVLDPAVGNGALLEPFFLRSLISNVEIFAIDTDSRPLKKVEQKFRPKLKDRLKIVKEDFLKWAPDYHKKCIHNQFDCVVMNPPFAARRQKWKPLKAIMEFTGFDGLPKAGPIEAGFVLASIALLRKGGRLLAILPASLMATPSLAWFRDVMAKTGTIRHVHELPRFTFPKIESRIYLVVFEKGVSRNETSLMNHDLVEPEKMLVATNRAVSVQRLDFRYHNSLAQFKVIKFHKKLGWHPLNQLAAIQRGSEQTPHISKAVMHTDDCPNGFWIGSQNYALPLAKRNKTQIRRGDILVKRVSRNCSRSFGLAYKIDGALCSDCILIIRPKPRVSSTRLLFAIRCLLTLEFGPALLERGTGASYISQIDLGRFEIPYALSKGYSKHFERYLKLVKRRDFFDMKKIEVAVAKELLGI